MFRLLYTFLVCRILVDVEAKYRVLRHSTNFIHRLLKLAHHPALEVSVNSVKMATLLVESPEGKTFFMAKNFQAVEDLLKIPNSLLKRVVETLIDVITWKP